MPRLSSKQCLLNELDETITIGYFFDFLNSKEIEELVEYRLITTDLRCLVPITNIPKNRAMLDMLWMWNENEFKQETRMSRNSFKTLVRMIEDHAIFHNNSRNPQAPVWEQVFIALRRFGCEGNAISVGMASRYGGVSVGSICKYTDRVTTAIYDIGHSLIEWPNAIERQQISNRFHNEHGLKGAVAIVDGTQIVIAQRPHIDGETYYTRKGRYSINLQIVCDDKRLVRSYVVGWPGSVNDSTVFGDSDISKNPNKYFTQDRLEYILADSGYASQSWLCTPYRHPAAAWPQNKIFNELFSSGRVIIEHLNGILKGRWASLRGLRNQMKVPSDFINVNKHIVSCLILHNFLIISNDIWPNEEEYQEENENEIALEQVQDINAINLRAIVQHNLLTWYQSQ
jgi:hypothetical protein